MPKRGPHTIVWLLLKLISDFHLTLQLFKVEICLENTSAAAYQSVNRKVQSHLWLQGLSVPHCPLDAIQLLSANKKESYICKSTRYSFPLSVLFLGQVKDHPNQGVPRQDLSLMKFQ